MCEEEIVEDLKVCPECHCDDLFRSSTMICCPDCGLVLSDVYPYTAGVLFDLPFGVL